MLSDVKSASCFHPLLKMTPFHHHQSQKIIIDNTMTIPGFVHTLERPGILKQWLWKFEFLVPVLLSR